MAGGIIAAPAQHLECVNLSRRKLRGAQEGGENDQVKISFRKKNHFEEHRTFEKMKIISRLKLLCLAVVV